eukprot:315588_1
MATSISPATLFKMIILCIVLIIIPQIDANGNLTVSCTGTRSCGSARINCPVDGVCHVDATDASRTPSDSLVIDAADMISGTFTVYSARSGTVKCPAEGVEQTNYYGSYFVCNQASECKTHTISCTEGQDCDVTCSGDYSCQSNQIICSGDCGVTCSASYGCKSAQIITTSQTRSSVICSGGRSCEYSRITCGDGSDCNVDCTGENACNGATIDGPTNGNLTVSCTGTRSCGSARINCPVDGVCHVDATDASRTPSDSLVIDAADMISGTFTVYSARSGTVKCPAEGV